MIGLLMDDPWTRMKCLSSRIRAASYYKECNYIHHADLTIEGMCK